MRSSTFKRILLTGILSVLLASGLSAQSDCPSVDGLESLLKPRSVLMLGEIHGTQQAPEMVARIACHAAFNSLELVVALELPQTEQALVDAYLDGNNPELALKALLDAETWSREYQDGRNSQAMLDLMISLRQLRDHQKRVSVLLIDAPSAGAKRDSLMAANIITSAFEIEDRMIVSLTGNLHNRITPGADRMGRYVADVLGEANVRSLDMEYLPGTAWVCLSGDPCGVQSLSGRGTGVQGIRIDSGSEHYHGVFGVGTISASVPARLSSATDG